jgi:hypothetical protein
MLPELDHLDMVMIRAEWLKQWMATGDVHGVADYLARLPEESRREITLAALYVEGAVA